MPETALSEAEFQACKDTTICKRNLIFFCKKSEKATPQKARAAIKQSTIL
jgi:hypothetical protein